MKKLIIAAGLFLSGMLAYSQVGLEGIIVEQVPVPGTATEVPAGSIAYRVFVDMAPNWGMQIFRGLTNNGQELFFQTSTQFYNHSSETWNGRSMTGTTFTNANGFWDSYLTISGVTSTRAAVLRAEDTDGTVDGFLTVPTNSVLAFSQQGNTGSDDFATAFGADQFAGKFSTYALAGYVTGDVQGPTSHNRVLIGQFTTNGDFSFEINIQLRRVVSGVATVENYAARTPFSGEFLDTRLRYTSVNAAPSVSLTAPSNGASYIVGSVVNLAATADDTDGTINQVEFFRTVGGVTTSIGIDSDPTGGWTYDWTSQLGVSTQLTARATDNGGRSTTSTAVSISVNPVPANQAPVVTNVVPAAATTILANAPFTLSATVTDPDGTIASVQFLVNGSVVGTGTLGAANSYSYSWTPTLANVGSANIQVRATDNGSAVTTTTGVSVIVQDPSAAYRIESQTAVCTASDVFCVPIVATTAVTNALGFDMVMYYNAAKVRPTGIIFVSENLIANEDWTGTSINIENVNNLMHISLFLNGAMAANGAKFNGQGQLICVEFAKTDAFQPADSANFTIANIYESYATTVTPKLVTDGSYSTTIDQTFTGSLLYWKGNSPMGYTAGTNLITNIFGSTNCATNTSATAVQPDINGVFEYNITNGNFVKIKRDIASTTDVMDVINGADAQLTQRVIVNDPTFRPNAYQIVAMDVNRDGHVSAGDVSQINNRITQRIGEYEQASINGSTSEEWLFIDEDLTFGPDFRIAANYPANNLTVGYHKDRVPVIENCDQIEITAYNAGCNLIADQNYKGILLGDVNGSYNTSPANPLMKSASVSVVLDLASATEKAGYIEVPVYVNADEEVTSLDIALQSESIDAVVAGTSDIQAVSHYNKADKTMRFTSNSLKKYDLGSKVATVRFTKSGKVNVSDIKSAVAYVNGKAASIEMSEIAINASPVVSVYPNPSEGIFNVEVSVDAKIVVMHIDGRIVAESFVFANQMQEINVTDMANGMYIMKVYNDEFVSIKKVIVKK